jgi:hypothetical protein
VVRALRAGWVAFLAALAAPGWADEVDDLFQAPAADIVAAAPAAPPPTANDLVRPFATLSTWGAGASNGANSSFYFQTDLSGGLDFRPDDGLRLLVSLSTTLPNGTAVTFSPPVISELFVDYSLADWAVVRFGQFGLTWGQARLVDNVGNLVSAAGSGVTAKASVPAAGLVLVASGQGPLDAHKVPAQMLYAASVEQSWGPATVGVSASQTSGASLTPVWQGVAFVRTSFAGADWYLEGAGTWKNHSTPYQAVGTAGVFWQGGFPVWTVNAEYQYSKVDDSLDNDTATSDLAVSVDAKRDWGFSPKLLWAEAWDDKSGQLIAAAVFEPADHLTVTAGLPWVYGPPGSRFVVANPDPAGRWWAFGLKAALAWNY